MKRFIMGCAILVAALAGVSERAHGAPARPNIILMFADDMGYSDLGCYGSEIRTPNLDRLAANGLRYSQMYNTSKCTTSRSSLLTGRYVVGPTYARNYGHGPTVGEMLKAAGYRTLWSGKNHSRILPPERGFDRFYGFQGGACNYWNPGSTLRDGGAFPRIGFYKWMVNDKWIDEFIPEDPEYYMTDAITDAALAWLEEYKGEDKPYFLYLAYNAPHWPLHARQKDIATYKGVYDAGYQKIRQARYERMVEKGFIDPKTAPLNPQKITDWNSLPKQKQQYEAQLMEVHAAMVDCLDQNIGRVVAKVKELGELDNTLILFLVDNGASPEKDKRAYRNYRAKGKQKQGSVMTYECIGADWAKVANTPLAKYKVTSHEGGVCTPMITHWPKGIQARGGWYHEPGHLVDLMSTFLELAGHTYPKSFNSRPAKPLEGVSLVPSFTGQSLAERPGPIGYSFKLGRGIRTMRWKLVRLGGAAWELYDMLADRTETNDLASSMPEKVEEMLALFKGWYALCRK
jgi:arylsulfatase